MRRTPHPGWRPATTCPLRCAGEFEPEWRGRGADVALFFSAVKLTSIVNATIIGSLQPVVVGVIASRFFGESIRLRDAVWSLMALAGVILVVSASAGDDVHDIRGDLLALAAMLSWSAYFIASKSSKRRMTSTEFTAGTALWTALICTPLGFAFGQDMSWPSWTNWGLLLAMAVGAGIVGHALMNWSLVSPVDQQGDHASNHTWAWPVPETDS